MHKNIYLTLHEGALQPLPWSHEDPLVRYHFGAYENFFDGLTANNELGYLDAVVPLPGVADTELGILPVRFEQALASAERAYSQRAAQSHSIYPGFGASVSLSGLNTQAWPLPKLME